MEPIAFDTYTVAADLYRWLVGKKLRGCVKFAKSFPQSQKMVNFAESSPPPNAQRKFAPLLTSYDSFKTSDVQYDWQYDFGMLRQSPSIGLFS